MVDAEDLARMLHEATANDEFMEQLETWSIDPEAFGQLLAQYSEHAGEYHTEEGHPPSLIVLTAMVAGFEIGYRCRLQVESESEGPSSAWSVPVPLTLPDVWPGASAPLV